MITVVVGKEIEKIKGDFESYLNGLNMVGEISYSQYSELYDEGVKQIQRAYELGKAELKEAVKHFNPCGEWNDDVHDCEFRHYAIEYGSKLTKAKELLEQWMQTSKASGCDNINIVTDTEQFLSEVEK